MPSAPLTPTRLRLGAATACLACIVCFLLSACASSPAEYFYTLSPAGLPAGAAHAGAVYRVALGPVKVPEIVDRPQFVIRQGANRVDIVEQHRWAQPLRSEIAHALTADLERQLPQAQIIAYNDAVSQDADYRITIDVEQFDAMPGEAVTVQILWSVRRASGSVAKIMRSTVREPVAGAGYDALAAAYSRALSRISTEIAAAVASLQTDKAR